MTTITITVVGSAATVEYHTPDGPQTWAGQVRADRSDGPTRDWLSEALVSALFAVPWDYRQRVADALASGPGTTTFSDTVLPRYLKPWTAIARATIGRCEVYYGSLQLTEVGAVWDPAEEVWAVRVLGSDVTVAVEDTL